MKVNATGVGSGVNVRELVDGLLEAESKNKIKKFDNDEATTLAKITAFGTLKSAMSDFIDKINELQSVNKFELRSANASLSNNKQIILPTASAQATSGNYTIEVLQLALGQKSGSVDFAQEYTEVGTGTLTFTIGTAVYDFEINDSNKTLQGISETINAASGSTGISSSLITSETGTKIVFSSKTGLNNAFTVSVTNDNDGNDTNASGLSQLASPNLIALQSPLNSQVKIDGVTIESASNTISNAIKGVSFDLLTTNIGDPISLSIAVDVQSAQNAIYEFVESYNYVFDSVSRLTQYDGTTKQDSMGILIGDATLRNIEFQMRRILTDVITTQPAGFRTLSQIGITSDVYTGKLLIDDSTLSEALNDNFEAVGNLFMDSTNGVLDKMESLVDNYVEVNGILQSKEDGLRKTLDVINEQRISLERHLLSLEKRLLQQFTAMDAVVAQLKSLSEYLETQLDKLAEPLMFRK